jgi:uncharacterized membrane protein
MNEAPSECPVRIDQHGYAMMSGGMVLLFSLLVFLAIGNLVLTLIIWHDVHG